MEVVHLFALYHRLFGVDCWLDKVAGWLFMLDSRLFRPDRRLFIAERPLFKPKQCLFVQDFSLDKQFELLYPRGEAGASQGDSKF